MDREIPNGKKGTLPIVPNHESNYPKTSSRPSPEPLQNGGGREIGEPAAVAFFAILIYWSANS
jgi:hypothetical protein